MKKLNVKGFTGLEVILIVVVVGLVSAAGWYVVQSKDKSDDASEQTSNSQGAESSPQDKTEETTEEIAVDESAYLVIEEWGVKIKIAEAEKVTYEYTSGSGTDYKGQYDSSIIPKIKPEYLTDKGCNPGVALVRYTTLEDSYREGSPKVGNYYFGGTGSPERCENETDNALSTSIRNDMAQVEAL